MIAGHHQGLCSQSYLGFVDEEHETAKRRHLKSCCLEKEKEKKKQDMSNQTRKSGQFHSQNFFFKLITKQNTGASVSGERKRDKNRNGDKRGRERQSTRERKRSCVIFCTVLRKQKNPDDATAQSPNKLTGNTVLLEKICFLLCCSSSPTVCLLQDAAFLQGPF